jgi:hypothetical protein
VDYTFSSAERIFVAGKTGTGKTTVVRELLRPVKRVVVFDAKGTLTTPEWNLETWSDRGRRRLLDGEDVRLRVPAPLDGNWSPYLETTFEAGDLTAFFDEMYGVVPPGKRPPEALVAMYTRGREFNIGTWAATQRPVWVPLFCKSEAEWMFVFRLMLEDDRKHMAAMCGPSVLTPIRDPFGFYVYNQLWDDADYLEGIEIPPPQEAVSA